MLAGSPLGAAGGSEVTDQWLRDRYEALIFERIKAARLAEMRWRARAIGRIWLRGVVRGIVARPPTPPDGGVPDGLPAGPPEGGEVIPPVDGGIDAEPPEGFNAPPVVPGDALLVAPVPEPATLWFAAMGLATCGFLRRRSARSTGSPI